MMKPSSPLSDALPPYAVTLVEVALRNIAEAKSSPGVAAAMTTAVIQAVVPPWQPCRDERDTSCGSSCSELMSELDVRV